MFDCVSWIKVSRPLRSEIGQGLSVKLWMFQSILDCRTGDFFFSGKQGNCEGFTRRAEIDTCALEPQWHICD